MERIKGILQFYYKFITSEFANYFLKHLDFLSKYVTIILRVVYKTDTDVKYRCNIP